MILYAAILVGIIYLIYRYIKNKKTIDGHWATLIEDFEFKPTEFYELVQTKLKSKTPQEVHSFTVSHSEGSIGSDSRVYLRITYKDVFMDICSAPFGTGHFFSYWRQPQMSMGEVFLRLIPFIGDRLATVFYPMTFHKADSTSMFITSVHNTIVSVIDTITEGKGTRALTPEERKPILKDLFKR